MKIQTLTSELSKKLGVGESELIYKGLLALIQKEIRKAEHEIVALRERYDVFSETELYDSIKNGEIVEHPAWEDYIIWKNKKTHIKNLQQMVSE
ncbi:hypothetical protein H8E88_11775 [candidate division KSB1 bacterium]|nr:hypothetical protein [candidate division KSB1 bacterium]MBL7092848.1 hypothetical protein [candidate division KSB1 bacterium]